MNPLATTVRADTLVASGSGAACPLAVVLLVTNASVRAGAAVQITWTVVDPSHSGDPDSFATIVSGSNSSNSGGGSLLETKPLVISHSAIHVCAQRNTSAAHDDNAACDPFSNAFQSANVTAVQRANASSFARNESVAFRSSNEVAFATPGEYTLAAYVVVSGNERNQRHDFVAYTTVSVLSSGETQARTVADADTGSRGGINSTVTGSSRKEGTGLPFGMSLGQFIVACALSALVLGCAVAVLVLSVKRKLNAQRQVRQRVKGSHTVALSPVTGESGQFRFSDWSEIYATQDALPSSILVDDRNTIAILRASRVSSPTNSVHAERKIADFTRDVGYWDVRPSASPITPLSSFFFASASSIGEDDTHGELRSPTESFVSLDTLGRRRTRPCHADALDDRGLVDDDDVAGDDDNEDDDEQEVEF
ncbi:hypothetical protein PybrP1_004464 [[Pythium] brassicae (nom. inval.)]|nr:hypothetical protein PybrP1_004464 [[Pythium] brassicae (nom. inval.)]